MIALDKMMSFSMLSCAAALAGALTVTGCAEPGGDEPEPVGEAEAALGQRRHIAPGLVQLFGGASFNQLVGFGYVEEIDDEVALQRFLLLNTGSVGDFVIREYDHTKSPAGVQEPPQTGIMPWWESLVNTLWGQNSLGTNKTYIVCSSRVYEQDGIYDGERWTSLPDPPGVQYPIWYTGASLWRPLQMTYSQPPSTVPVVSQWPIGVQDMKILTNPSLQIPVGDGKFYQATDLIPASMINDAGYQRGKYFAENGVFKDTSSEFFYLQANYDPAGSDNKAMRVIADNPNASFETFWHDIEVAWGPGSGLAVNGCVNYHQIVEVNGQASPQGAPEIL